MFDKKEHKEKVLKWIKDNGWNDISNELDDIMNHYRLEDFLYKPHFLIEKDGIPFLINYFLKGDYGRFKRFNYNQGTGFDWYKYKMILYLQGKTFIQAGVIMYNEQEDKYVFKQLDQIKKPIPFFIGYDCRALQLKPKYNDVVYNREGHVEPNCGLCFEKHNRICRQCIRKKYPGAIKRKRKEMAMWPVTEFGDTITIQPKLV